MEKKARGLSGDVASEHGGVNTMELNRGTTSNGHPDQGLVLSEHDKDLR